MTAYVAALALTLAIELPAYAGYLRRAVGVPVHRGLAAGAAVNLISHPVAFLVAMPRIDHALGYFPALGVVEIGVVLLEALLLCAWLRRDVDLLALAGLLVNTVSLAAGLLLIL